MCADLRKKAEDLLNRNPDKTPTVSTIDAQRLFHELNVHQIELQMQNEELRDAQHELAAARDAYAELYDFAPVGYLIIDFESRIIEANFTAATMLGVDRGKLPKQTFAKFVHRISLEAWDLHRREILESQKPQRGDFVLQRADGTSFTAQVNCLPRPVVGHFLVTMADITPRVEAEEALRKSEQELSLCNHELEHRVERRSVALRDSEEKYRRLFETETDAIMIFDGETRKFIDANHAAIQLYGYSREEFLQLKPGNITDEPEDSADSILKMLKGELSFIPMRRHRKKDGTVFPVEISACTFLLKGRRVACGVVRDITERVNRETELRKLTTKLSLAEQRERERIAKELHDSVSQLLSSSFLRLSILKESGSLPETAEEALGTICDILQDTLQQTRSLTFELSCPLLNELGLAAALEELCTSMTHEQSIRFEFQGTNESIPLHMDRKIVLFRSTRELLINVMKHSQAAWACVKLDRVGNNVCIGVKDNGKGFNASLAGTGFSPTGGFGLFNIREYLLHTGGNLKVDSIPGNGTEVVLTIPLEEVDD